MLPEPARKNACATPFFAAFTSMCRSRNWRDETSEGDSVMRHVPFAVFGKAITSRMLEVPQRIAMSRSKPRAMPPCGGAPYPPP